MILRNQAAAIVLAAGLIIPAVASGAPAPSPPVQSAVAQSPLDAQSEVEQIATSKIYIQRQQLRLELETQLNHHDIMTLYKQSVFDIIITILVFSITLAGIWMSYRQFEADLAAKKDGSLTAVKFGPGGIELSSSVIGLVVLATSLAFFYLYVKDIYPITELGQSPPAAAAPPAAK